MLKPTLYFLSLLILLSSCSSDDPDLTPTINSFSPDKGIGGTVLTISGSNFGETKSENSVLFNGLSATINSATANQLVVVVPIGATTGKFTVTANGLIGTSPSAFTIFDNPVITSFAPESGVEGSSVTITGSFFSAVQAENVVKFGEVVATITAASTTSLTVTVPASSNSTIISVTTNGLTVIAAKPFIVTPFISNISPISAATGATVTITGTGFSGAQITFNKVSPEIISRTETEIKVIVPNQDTPYTQVTTVTLKLYNGSSTVTYPTPFTYLATWVRKKDFPGTVTDRRNGISFAIGSKAYFGLGHSSDTQTDLKDLWQYDPVTDNWTQKNDFDGDAPEGAFCFVLDGRGYVGSGNKKNNDDTYSLTTDMWGYEPITDTWADRADFPGAGRIYAGTFVINEKGYVGAGYGEGTKLKDFWEYDPNANSWTQKADFAGNARGGPSAFSIGTKGYLGGGYTGSLDTYKEFWEYDLSSNQWTKKADINGGSQTEQVGFSINNLGYSGHDIYYTRYNAELNKWTRVDGPLVNTPASNGISYAGESAPAVVIDGKAYVLRGNELWVFTPLN